ncbi:hypothetical protein ACXO65_06440, partial [Lactobacillus delbrueckii subsp. bulgaricus]|nr:hypothetical protein [Lactobacillus delbrueckii subsp. bulgaricus]
MASYGNTVLTSAGIDLVQRVIANTTTFEITKVATSSDSSLTNATISTIEALTAMSSVQQTGKVTAFDTSNSKQVGLKCEFTNQSLTNQYDICGVGIYAKEAGKSEILFAVAPAKEPETMPAKPDDQSALFTFSLNMYVAVGQSSAMSITATTEGVVKSINGTIKPDANGNVTLSYYSRAEVDQKVSSLSSTINSLNSTKTNNTDFEAVKNRVAATESSLANAQSDISTLQHRADSITSTLSNGGRNLLSNTREINDSSIWGNLWAWEKGDFYNDCQIVQSSTIQWNGLYQYVYVEAGKKYTFSIDAKSGDNSNHTAHFYASLLSAQEGRYNRADIVGDGQTLTYTPTWARYSLTITAKTNGYVAPRIERQTTTNELLQLARPQFECGEIATPWQPSNGDIAATTTIANAAKTKADANANSIQSLSDETTKAI